MTLILGTVCDDGVVIAGDSKTVDSKTKKIASSYNIKKVHTVGTIAFGMAGTGYFEETAEALKKSIGQWLIFNPDIHLGVIVEEICNKPYEFLLTDKSNLTIVVANKDFLYSIHARTTKKGYVKREYHQVHAAIAGIKDYEMPDYSGTKTTKELAEFLKQTIKLNRGPYVGGRTQVVILKNDKTPLQIV